MCRPPTIISLLALAAISHPATAVQPVNRYFSAANAQPQPDLQCLVGIDSKDVSELYKVGKLSENILLEFFDENIAIVGEMYGGVEHQY